MPSIAHHAEFGFFIDRKGRRQKSELLFEWRGVPCHFSYQVPYIVAIDRHFMEVWTVPDAAFVHILPVLCSNIFSVQHTILGATLASAMPPSDSVSLLTGDTLPEKEPVDATHPALDIFQVAKKIQSPNAPIVSMYA